MEPGGERDSTCRSEISLFLNMGFKGIVEISVGNKEGQNLLHGTFGFRSEFCAMHHPEDSAVRIRENRGSH